MTAATAVTHGAEMKRLGGRARELRKFAGLTQQEVADAVGITRQTIVRFESGMHDLGASRLVALATALDVPPTAFWERQPKSASEHSAATVIADG